MKKDELSPYTFDDMEKLKYIRINQEYDLDEVERVKEVIEPLIDDLDELIQNKDKREENNNDKEIKIPLDGEKRNPRNDISYRI